MVAGVVLDLVDPMAETVKGKQPGECSSDCSPTGAPRAIAESAELGEIVETPLAALADERLGGTGEEAGLESPICGTWLVTTCVSAMP